MYIACKDWKKYFFRGLLYYTLITKLHHSTKISISVHIRQENICQNIICSICKNSIFIFYFSYCDHLLSNELDGFVKLLMQDIVRFQDRQYAKDPIKAKARKRYVVGLREIKKFLEVKKISLLLLAPDVEPVQIKGGLDDTIAELIQLAKENEVSKRDWNCKCNKAQ